MYYLSLVGVYIGVYDHLGVQGKVHDHLGVQGKVGNELGKGRVGDEAEVPRGIAEVLVEPGGEHAEEKVIIDLGADIAKLVSES